MKSMKIIKEERLSSLKVDVDDCQLEELVGLTKKPEEAVRVVRRYEEILKTKSFKIVNIVGKLGQVLKQFTGLKEIFKLVGLSCSTIYFKINLHKSFCK